MADQQPPKQEDNEEEGRPMITYEPETAAPKSTQTSPQVLLSPMPKSEPMLPVSPGDDMHASEPESSVPHTMADSPQHFGGTPERGPVVQPPQEQTEQPSTPPVTALPPATLSEMGSLGTAKTHFEPPPTTAAHSWPSQPTSPFVATPPKAFTPLKTTGGLPNAFGTPTKAGEAPPKTVGTPPKATATTPKAVAIPPRSEMQAGPVPATGVLLRSDSEPIAMPASGPVLTQQTVRKSATVGDVTNVTEKQELQRKWEGHQYFESAPAKEYQLEVSRRERIVKSMQTFSIHLSFFGMGMYNALFGPTLQDLAVTLDVDLYHGLFLLAAREIGYFLGAVAGGVLLRPLNPQVLLIMLDFFLAMACLGVSYFDTLLQSQLVFGLGGFALGAINIVGILWISALHRDASGFLVQTLGFMYCIGCSLAPILGEPFLTQRSLLQPRVDLPPAIESELAFLTSLEDKDFIYVAYAYWVVGLYVFVVVFLTLVAFSFDPRHQDLRPMETQCPIVPCNGLIVVLFLYLLTSVAMEIIYSQLVAPYTLLLGHNKTTAAYVTSAFWAAYSSVRGVSIMCLKQRGSFNVLLCCNVFLVAATGCGSVFGYQTRVMWIGTALAGACMAPMMPSTLLLLHDYSGVSVSRFILAVLTVTASSAFAPLCLGAELERKPMLFYYTLAALAVLCLLLVLAARTMVRRTAIEDGYALLRVDRRLSHKSSK